MKRKRKLKVIVAMAMALCLALLPAISASAANPTITMTVTAGTVSITNSQDTWALGNATTSEVIHFSATGAEDDDYSTVNNTGSLAVDVQIQGVNFEGGDYDWTLGATSDNQTYSLYANSGNGTSTYDIEVKSSAYGDLITNLPSAQQWVWSMKFTAPNWFDPDDDLGEKSATITLVARETGT